MIDSDARALIGRASDIDANDPARYLEDGAWFVAMGERMQRQAVDALRAAGWTWQRIAERTGTTKQAASQLHVRRHRSLHAVTGVVCVGCKDSSVTDRT